MGFPITITFTVALPGGIMGEHCQSQQRLTPGDRIRLVKNFKSIGRGPLGKTDILESEIFEGDI